MKLIKYTGKTPEYIDGFSKKCERSREGSIHLLPNATIEISDDEFEHIKKKYSFLKVFEIPKEKPAVKKVEVVVAPAITEEKPEVVVVSEEDVGDLAEVLEDGKPAKKKK